MSAEIISKLELACVASCGCLTKTPDFQHHAADCRYRVLNEAMEFIGYQAETIANQSKIIDASGETIASQRLKIRGIEQLLISYNMGSEAEIAQLRAQLAPVTAANYGPTLAADINALPARLRSYVHDLETRADPTWDVRRAFVAEENAAALNKHVEELEQQVATLKALLTETARRIRDTPAPTSLVARIELALNDLCDDCPPPGYPNNKTRCVSCPRRGASNV